MAAGQILGPSRFNVWTLEGSDKGMSKVDRALRQIHRIARAYLEDNNIKSLPKVSVNFNLLMRENMYHVSPGELREL